MPGIQIVGSDGFTTDVSSKGRLRTVSVSTPPEHCINYTFGDAYYLQLTVTPSASADFLYIKNTSINDMILENMFVSCATDEEINIYRNPAGTPTGGSEITPLNSNFGSNKQANGSFIYGSDLSGLTAGGLFNSLPCYSGTNNAFTFRNWVIMPRNSTISFMAVTGNIELDVSLPFFFMVGDL